MVRGYKGLLLESPFKFTKVRLELGGNHYHTEECPASHPEGFPWTDKIKPVEEISDYAVIEVPTVVVEGSIPVTYLDRSYRPCPMCLPSTKRS